jgi:hypothetical protein
MEWTIERLAEIFLILAVAILLVFAVQKIKERTTAAYTLQDPFCEQSGLKLNDFSEKLKIEISKKSDKAKLLYEMSAECFKPEQIRIEEAIKKPFLCNGGFELEEEQKAELKEYCEKS